MKMSNLHFAWGTLLIAEEATFVSKWPGFGTVSDVLFGVLGKTAQMKEFELALYNPEIYSRGIWSRQQG